jgi:hypothetical protein
MEGTALVGVGLDVGHRRGDGMPMQKLLTGIGAARHATRRVGALAADDCRFGGKRRAGSQ